MADVNLTPRVRCDNCGLTEDKTLRGKEWSRPRSWGAIRAEGSRNTDSYGGKDRMVLADLCPTCAQVALDAAADALRLKREGKAS